MTISTDDDVWLNAGGHYIVIGVQKDILSLLNPITLKVMKAKTSQVVKHMPYDEASVRGVARTDSTEASPVLRQNPVGA